MSSKIPLKTNRHAAKVPFNTLTLASPTGFFTKDTGMLHYDAIWAVRHLNQRGFSPPPPPATVLEVKCDSLLNPSQGEFHTAYP
ncbi:Hypothetical predicted protein [Podarcis lilfordi]|uniref:Uncharacterized protein n=1 Tax=Podarcis lilfordi TaxID=74358 RepID=A0AA35L0Q6_9SAUR|nr:Hypothetical predicted protein [Podarcis lilfordi]